MGMTKEEAIKTLKENYCAICAYGSQDMDSCDIRSCDNRDAIKALEQEPTTKNDLSSGLEKNSKKLEKPTTKNCESCRYYGSHYGVCNYCYKCSLWTEGETITKNDLGVDCISRAKVLKLMKDNWHTHNGDWAMQESLDDIRALPSVTPQEPKMGHWINRTHTSGCGITFIKFECSSCHKKIFDDMDNFVFDYCPNCGAKMIESQESEDKE